MRVFLTGATGLIGTPIIHRLRERGDTPVVLTRDARSAGQKLGQGLELVEGNPQQPGDWQRSVDGCQGIINLVGEPLFGRRWNDRQKQVLRDSRVLSTQNVVAAIAAAADKPRVLVNASAIGYYGDVPEGELTEKAPPGEDYLSRLCADWEAASLPAAQHGTRVAQVRIGVVLDKHEGALKQMLLPFKLGLGGPVGWGRQWVSWIHLDDIVGIFLAALDNPQAVGPVNGTGPEPVRNRDFSKSLAKALHRPCLFPVPPVAVRALFGEVAMVVTGGQKVLPAKAQDLGYQFRYANCDAAMQALFG
jgi:uncharacterized protein (TIGR01777 family)